MQTVYVNQLKIAALSVLCTDYYPQQKTTWPGGNSLNFAVHAKRIGAGKVSVAGFIGNDPKSKIVLECLKTEKIDISNVFQLKGNTPSNSIFNTSDGERYSKPGSWDNGVRDAGEFTEETWSFLLGHQIIAIPYLDKNIEELLRRRTKEHFIIMDFLHFDDPGIVREFLPYIDIAFTSPEPEHVPGLKKLASESDTLLITMLGAQGSRAFLKNNEYIQSAFKVKKVTDTTGCGDSYQAGFICSYFIHRDIQKAMLEGTTTATQVLTHYGGV